MPQQKQEERQQRQPRKKSGMGLFIPAVIAVVLIGGAAIGILGGQKNKNAAEKPTEVSTKPKPFEGMPPEEPPKKKSGGSATRFIAQAPDGLASDATWQKAVKLAAEGEKLFEEATAAKAAQNVPLLNQKGAASRDKLNEAIDLTAAWEEDLLTKYGDANAEVRRIVQTRSSWLDKVRWLHKSIAL